MLGGWLLQFMVLLIGDCGILSGGSSTPFRATGVVPGDWNVVKFPSEKLGGRTMTTDMVGFSEWINKHSLIDPHLGGTNFTWSNHQLSPTMLHLDRFLPYL